MGPPLGSVWLVERGIASVLPSDAFPGGRGVLDAQPPKIRIVVDDTDPSKIALADSQCGVHVVRTIGMIPLKFLDGNRHDFTDFPFLNLDNYRPHLIADLDTPIFGEAAGRYIADVDFDSIGDAVLAVLRSEYGHFPVGEVRCLPHS